MSVDLNIEAVTSSRFQGWVWSISKSILGFILIFMVGATIIPLENDINTKVVFFVAISTATAVLFIQIPGILYLRKMSLSTTVTAIMAGAALPVLSLLAPLNPRYLENFTSLSFPQQIAYVVFAWALFPVVEEIYFRGLVFPIGASRMGYGAGAILSIALFVLYHLRSTGMAGLAVQGAIYTWLRYRYDNASPSILAHSIHNCTLLVIANLRG